MDDNSVGQCYWSMAGPVNKVTKIKRFCFFLVIFENCRFRLFLFCLTPALSPLSQIEGPPTLVTSNGARTAAPACNWASGTCAPVQKGTLGQTVKMVSY